MLRKLKRLLDKKEREARRRGSKRTNAPDPAEPDLRVKSQA